MQSVIWKWTEEPRWPGSKTNLKQVPKSPWATFQLLTCLLDNGAGKLTITPTKRTWWDAEPLSSCWPSHITVGLQKAFLMAFSDLSVQNWIFHNTPDSPWFTVCYVLNGFLVTSQVHYGRRGNLISSLPQDTNTEQGRNTNDRAQLKKTVRLKLQQYSVSNSFQYLLGHNHLLIITTLVSRAPRQPGGDTDFEVHLNTQPF